MMKSRNFATLVVLTALTAAAMMSAASTASADSFLYGTRTGGIIFKYDLNTNLITNSFAAAGPDSLVLDSLGRIIYTSEATGTVHRINQDGTGDVVLATGLFNPKDLVIEPDGTHALVSESLGHRIARIELCAVPPCVAVTYLGGPANFYSTQDGPHGLVYDGARLFADIGDRFGGNQDSRVAEINPVTGAIIQSSTTLFPNRSLDGLTYDFSVGNLLYATSTGLGVIYQFNPAVALGAGSVAFTIGAPNQTFSQLDGLTFDTLGNLYVAAFGIGSLQRCAIVTNVGFDGNSLAAGTCTSLASIPGIDDLAPFFQTNPPTTVPEPASLVLLGTGLLGLARYRRRRSQ